MFYLHKGHEIFALMVASQISISFIMLLKKYKMKKLISSIVVFTVFCFFYFPLQGIRASPIDSAGKKSISFEAQKKWLQIPVKNGAVKRDVELLVNGEKVRWFNVELADGQPDWFAYLDISDWKGKSMELILDSLSSTSHAFAPIIQSDQDSNANQLYAEEYRGQFHFSPKRGWNNDPNGLAYYNGEYHLFFQHNPYGVDWGNMHWGHAVSTDLVHWKEIGEALYPDKDGTMFSGGGVVDVNNTSGFGKEKNFPLVLFYTAAENTWDQSLAYSVDGRTFNKIGKPVVKKITDGNRDPKVIWHEPTKKWVMILYVTEEGDQHAMHFFTSKNMKDWTPSSIVKGGIGDDRYLFECPEFFELEIEGANGEKKWVLTGANSEYAIGTFDGITFTPEIERLNGQVGRDFYAAQTFSNEPKGRRIEIGWWRTHTKDKGMVFNQSMSIPMELKLIKTGDGTRLSRTPVEELHALRKKEHSFVNKKIGGNSTSLLKDLKIDLAEIYVDFELGKAEGMVFDIRGVLVKYDVKKQELSVDGVKAKVPMTGKKLELTMYVDRTGLEIFANKGLVFMPININLDPENQSLAIKTNGGEAIINRLTVYELGSSWLKDTNQ